MMTTGWMNQSREYWLGRLASDPFDLIIIGGGITGAGVAREASLAGLKVALLEAADFASGTSSRSTKLIHGGLRYLAQGKISLVRESGRERSVLHRLAPHLITPIPFVLPIYQGMKHGLLAMSLAIGAYDRLAAVERKERRQVLSRSQMQEEYPFLPREGLRGGVRYHEYVTDDARLTLSTLQSATEWGAVVMNHCPVVSFMKNNDQLCGVCAVDQKTGRELQIRGRIVVNAAGPWIEKVLELNREPENGTSLVTHSRGIHLSFARERLTIPHALAFQTPDGRLVFFIPKGDITYVGTTDQRYDGDLHHPIVSDDEVQYLLELINRYLPQSHVNPSDIIGIWSGVRPLVSKQKGDSQDTKDISREDEIWIDPCGLITIAGGKLTAYRKMAERILVKVQEQMSHRSLKLVSAGEKSKALSAHLPLFGAKSIPFSELRSWTKSEASRLSSQYAISIEDAQTLIHRFGDAAETVLIVEGSNQRVMKEFSLLESEIVYMIRFEMAIHVSDVIVRRTELGRFQSARIAPLIKAVSGQMKFLLNWTEQQRQEEEEKCLIDCYQHIHSNEEA
jgi:glycerol-3-phosphate dehydrogenase